MSWTEESAKIGSGSHDVKIYDEEGFAALRKVCCNILHIFILFSFFKYCYISKNY